MPMGPIELADQVGLDICLDVGDMLRTEVRRSAAADAGLAARKGRQGRARPQDRQGLLHLEGRQGAEGAARPRPARRVTDQMIDRLVLPMSNVCVACLREGIVDDADVVDGAMIFGTGYAPFRGGPLNYARTRGVENVGRPPCAAWPSEFGERFAPDAGWDSFKRGKTHDATPRHAPTPTTEPSGDLCIRTLAMPADTNANGDIFGGWLLSQMDVGGGVFASKVAKSRTVTVAIEAMNFRKAVYVGDLVSVYANLVRVGRTSLTVHLEAWALRARKEASRSSSPTAISPTSRSTITAVRRPISQTDTPIATLIARDLRRITNDRGVSQVRASSRLRQEPVIKRMRSQRTQYACRFGVETGSNAQGTFGQEMPLFARTEESTGHAGQLHHRSQFADRRYRRSRPRRLLLLRFVPPIQPPRRPALPQRARSRARRAEAG